MIDETLEIGTRESAVEAFVNLMSAALNMPEKKLHYWLDCYYQLRSAYEREKPVFCEMQIAPVTAGTPEVAEEPAAVSVEGAPEQTKTSVKQETHARLMAAREKGVTIAQLHTASGKKLTEGDICGMLNSMPLSEAKWKLMKKALDKLDGEEA